MTVSDLGSIGELIAAVATTATLGYLALQIRQSNRTNEIVAMSARSHSSSARTPVERPPCREEKEKKMRNGSRAASGLAAGLVLLIAAAGGAQTSEKEKLARELILVAGGADMARQITDMMLASVQTNYASMVEQMIAAQGDLTPEQKQEVRTHLADYDRFASEFSRRVAAEIDYEQIMYEVYVPLYDRYFTEDELRQLLAFQKSPIGQKSIAVTPQLMQEGMAASVPRIQPALIKIVTEVMATQQADALEDVD